MPATSKAQWRKLALLHKQGKISDEEWRRFTEGVNYDSLPERVKKKRRSPAEAFRPRRR